MSLFQKEETKQSQAWLFDYISCSQEDLFLALQTGEKGLSEYEVKQKLINYGKNEPSKKKKQSLLCQILAKFANPLVIALLTIASVSLFFGETISALIVILMAFTSVILAFVQEYRAGQAADKLQAMVRTTATVTRGGRTREIQMSELVPGDIVTLSAGDMIPADIRLLTTKDFFLNQSSLTGESFPVEKHAKVPIESNHSLIEKKNIAFMGSSVVSGSATALVIHSGSFTQFGELFLKLSMINVETNFDKSLKKLTMLMVKVMLAMVAFIFAIIAVRNGHFLEAFLFSLGVAVGLTPEMLPMIVTMTLSKGALLLSKKDVIVKRLNSIQNFGAMDILCTDKTGTLTLDKIVLEKHCDVDGTEDEEVLRYAYINSFYQTGLKNVLDKAILKHEKLAVHPYEKIDEIPFDFVRKIMSVVIRFNGTRCLIAKGAPEEIFKRITHYELKGQIKPITPEIINDVAKEYTLLSEEGFRVLAIAYKNVSASQEIFSREDEKGMILKGYVAFLDPPKPTAKKALLALKNRGITVKVLTGDNELVTRKICSEVGLENGNLLTGEAVEKASDSELQALVETTHIFARLLPLQKERVIRALHANGHVVGYLGDGINDALALKTSDVGISVNNAVDIAKESADIILLKKSLMVLEDGIIEGRRTFGNIIKYIKMGTSSNFGNMLSMTGASLFLPFLPMLPIQILLNNFLYDLSQVAIPTDDVDKEYLLKPRAWNINSIKKFMFLMGPISSIFDYITFAVLLFLFNASPALFHTGWFMESLLTQTLVIHIIRTAKIPFVESWPSRLLILSSLLIVAVGLALPLSPIGAHFGFTPPPPLYFVALFCITSGYLILVQRLKQIFIRKYGLD
jgi:Mg2+-importing ATPase